MKNEMETSSSVLAEGAAAGYRSVASAYAARFANAFADLDSSILRLGSIDARDIVALQASQGRFSASAISELAIMVGHDATATALWKTFSGPALIRLARILALQDIEAVDRAVACRIVMAVLQVHGPAAVPRSHRKLLVELYIFLGDETGAQALLKLLPAELVERPFMQADMANPWGSGADDVAAWVALMNEALGMRGDEQISVAPAETRSHEDAAPFGGLCAQGAKAGVIDGPLVSICVSTWKPDDSLLTSIKSLLAQSWRNLEILLIDDCSPDEYLEVLTRAAALDPRIRLLRQERNGGTYLIRNRALELARGTYFTVQDSDDWSHPLRIERQVAMLQGDPELVAVHCLGFRTNEKLMFNYPGVAPVRVNESSLLFRREAVMSRIGSYHRSRKGADSEYSTRIRNTFGSQAVGCVREHLTAIRLSSGSLSRSEFKPGWRHPNRSIYRRNYDRWHGAVFAGGSLGYPRRDGETGFRAPLAFSCDPRAPVVELDWLFIGDFRRRSARTNQVLDVICSLRAEGAIIGINHLESMHYVTGQAFNDFDKEVVELLENGVIEVACTDQVRATNAVLMSAAVVQFSRTGLDSALVAHKATILASSEDLDGDKHGPWFDLLQCTNLAGDYVHCRPKWTPLDERARLKLNRHLFPKQITSQSWPVGVSSARWGAPTRLEGGVKVLGLILPEAGVEGLPHWLRTEVFGCKIRILTPSSMDEADSWPTGVEFVDERWRGRRSFLAGLDYFLTTEEWGPGIEPPRILYEALAAGCGVVLPASWRPHLSEGLDYYDPRVNPDVSAWMSPAVSSTLTAEALGWDNQFSNTPVVLKDLF